MRYSISLFLLLSSSAFAQEDPTWCVGAPCDSLERALSDAFAAQGLREYDSMAFGYDEFGRTITIVTSDDKAGLSRIASLTGGEVIYHRNLDSYTTTVPFLSDDITVEPVEPQPLIGLLLPAVQKVTGGGGGGGGGECTEVCWCTESGTECWMECP